MKESTWIRQILVFLAWLLDSILGFWIVVVYRNALLSGLAVYYVGESMPRAWRARFFDRAFFVIAGLAYLICIFVIDGYLRDGLTRGDVFRRFARVTGIELLALFPVDVFTSFLQRSLLGRYSLIVLPAELILGGALLVHSILARRERRRRGKPRGG